MKGAIALFITGKEDFFKEVACVGCSVGRFCVCDDVDSLVDIDKILNKLKKIFV